MDSEILVAEKFKEGAKLIEELESSGHTVSAALWIDDSDLDRWLLSIALGHFNPEVDARKYYRQIDEALSRLPEPHALELADIALVGRDDPVIRALRRSVLGKAESVEGARLGGNRLGDVFIKGAYLYRLHSPTRRGPRGARHR